jgi:hypothetical protein
MMAEFFIGVDDGETMFGGQFAFDINMKMLKVYI